MKSIALKKIYLILLFFGLYGDSVLAQQIFEPGLISIAGQHDDYISISPNEDFLMFTRFTNNYRTGTIYMSEKKNEKWQTPTIVPFSGTYNDSRPFISPQGVKVFFASNRPTSENPNKRDLDIWYVEKKGDTWGEPINAGNEINSRENDSHPSVALNGNLYFSRWGSTPNNMFMSEYRDGDFKSPIPLSAINTDKSESHTFIAPDESFLFFGKTIDPEGMNGQVFISINKDGRWSKPMSFDELNSDLYDYSAKLNAAKNRIYFSRTDFTSGGERADIYYKDVNWEALINKYTVQIRFVRTN